MMERICEYECEYHRGPVEWHHPISDDSFDIGLWLCQAHHSIICGRKKRYPGEVAVNKSLSDMRLELYDLEIHKCNEAGIPISLIDKH